MAAVADTIEELEAKLAAGRTARLEKQRADRAARELRILQEEVKLVELEATEGIVGRDIKAVFSPKDGAMVVVRTPTTVVFQRFQAKAISTKGNTVADLYDLIRGSLVYPDRPSMEKIFDAAPGMLTAVANAIMDLGGGAAEETAGK